MQRSTPRGLKLRITHDYRAMSLAAAKLIIDALRQKPDLLLCVAAGGSPAGTFQELAQHHRRQPGLFRAVRVLQVDEWCGLPAQSPATCKADLETKLLKPLGIGPERCQMFRGSTGSPQQQCERVARWLEVHGPIDFCLLGLGLNGHIAMNEPAEVLTPHPHVARLSLTSRHHPLLEGVPRRPRYGLTLGLGDLLRSQRVLLLVSGFGKRVILKKLLQPQVTTQLPASLLWLHPDATVLCDRLAAGLALLQCSSRQC
jgi:galactosamine-6-phosphate isomerase